MVIWEDRISQHRQFCGTDYNELYRYFAKTLSSDLKHHIIPYADPKLVINSLGKRFSTDLKYYYQIIYVVETNDYSEKYNVTTLHQAIYISRELNNVEIIMVHNNPRYKKPHQFIHTLNKIELI